ncbi:NHL domain-containing protein [Taibaiella soli]|uniref:Teneurin NHL domain-containing protein n=1 Tax=Taibaiella soli TaxID=1649169 RepID=A0A2W2BT34_9BACT|nr:T9SS type A sorting domain-containing protein [Taibaiella soli]PZF70923.1 hypothetical protein DN068_21080 [Taibaiella soli]
MKKLFLIGFIAFGTLLCNKQASGQTISTFAGGFGSGSAGTSTNLAMVPNAIAVDTAGNMYVIDGIYTSNCVRKIAPDGTSTVIAGAIAQGFSGDGGPSALAQLNNPTSLAVDIHGNVYIADYSNNRIRKITASTGIISTVAGTGVSGFNGDGGRADTSKLSAPISIAVDTAGNLYIADWGNYRIRKISAATGFISTVAGGNGSGTTGDGGQATLAKLYAPKGLAVDAAGQIYVGDNNKVRKIGTNGVINTIAGTGTGGYSGDNGLATNAKISFNQNYQNIALDAAGNIYLPDYTNFRVRRVDAVTDTITTFAGNGASGFAGDNGPAVNAQLGSVYAVAMDPVGNLYVADMGNDRIRKVTAGTGIITTVGGNGVVSFGGDGGAAAGAQFGNSIQGVAADVAGNVYISDGANYRVRKVTAATGIIATFAGNGTSGSAGDNGPATSANLNALGGLATDAAGNVYIADRSNHKIRKVNAAGTITTIAGNGSAAMAGDNGAATSASLNYPAAVALDAAGNLYIADASNNRVRKVDASGIITTFAGTGSTAYNGDTLAPTATNLYNPAGLAIDAAGNVYISESSNNRVRKITPAGVVSTVAGIGTAGYFGDGGPAISAKVSAPKGLALDGFGNLYIADYTNNVIRKLTMSTGIITTVAGINSAGFAGDGGPATSAKLNSPIAVAIDTAGHLYVADLNNRRIRVFNVATAIVPAISIATTQNPVCAGSSITFTATDAHGGTAPSYQWKVNGVNFGTSINTFSYTPANNDTVTCVFTSNDPNAMPATVNSNKVVVSVTALATPTVSIAAAQTSVCVGTQETITATPTNGGTAPVYQWTKNGVNVGTGIATYTYTPANNDVIACILTSNAVCLTTSNATSNNDTIHTVTSVTPAVSITASQNGICSGTSVVFTAVPANGGTAPGYQWTKNGANVGTGTATYAYVPAAGDVIACILTSNVTCATTPTATSNNDTMNVTTTVTPAVSINGQNNICSGTLVTYTATATNGGTTPAYQWTVGGTNVGTNNDTFSYVPANGDIVTCTLISNVACASQDTVSGNSITMVANPPVTPSVAITGYTGSLLAPGQAVTFTAAAANAGSNPQYQWRKNSLAISGATQSSYTAIAGVNVVDGDIISVWMKNTDACGDSATNVAPVVAISSAVNNVNAGDASFGLYPNPNDGNFMVKGMLVDKAQRTVTLEVFNAIGQRIYREDAAVVNGSIEYTVVLPKALPAGNYFLRLNADGNNNTIRFSISEK